MAIEFHVKGEMVPKGQGVENVPAIIRYETAVGGTVVARLAAIGKDENLG